MQINPSCILSYLGTRGFGLNFTDTAKIKQVNAIPLLAYWDIFKQYYANKQEQHAYVINNTPEVPVQRVLEIEINGDVIPIYPSITETPVSVGTTLNVVLLGAQQPEDIYVKIKYSGWYVLSSIFTITSVTSANITGLYTNGAVPELTIESWRYRQPTDATTNKIHLEKFELANIDNMREYLLSQANNSAAVDITNAGVAPYNLLLVENENFTPLTGSQEGLAVKTYQSDLFNNWLNTEYIDGAGGISEITAITTVEDKFTIDTLLLHKKVYEMLNDIMVSGGTYDDWQEVVYDHKSINRAETPIYYGSLIKELVFQEVQSNSESKVDGERQPLGTLAGRGRLGQKHKGGKMNIKVDEISYLIGIFSITPRIAYSQGNDWSTELTTMDDFHKPHLDEIGFQELTTNQMAWWDSWFNEGGEYRTRSAGKQPAWLNYMTEVDKIRGNFAMKNNSDFMVLDRRYEPISDATHTEIRDLTTYINPEHHNYVFAQTSLDSQNFWVNIANNITARRKLSARIMPRL